MEPIDPSLVERARKVLAHVRGSWLARPHVTGIDVGFRERRGRLTDEIALRVYVTRKFAASELSAAERFPSEVEGIGVDVIEFDPASAEPPDVATTA